MEIKIKEWVFNMVASIITALISKPEEKIRIGNVRVNPNHTVNIINSNVGQLNIYVSEVKNKELEERDFINVTDVDGVDKTMEVIAFFTLKMNGKDYIVYTDFPEKYTEDGNVIVYTSVVNDIGDTVLLEGLETQEEVDEIMQVFEDLSGESKDQIKHLGNYDVKK